VPLLGPAVKTDRVRAAAPPAARPSELRQVVLIEARAYQAALKGDFTEALRLERQALEARRRLQGPTHQLAINASLWTERWARMARLPAFRQRQAGRALRKDAEGARFRSKGQFAQADLMCREALAIRRKALGEEHPDTAASYNNVAACLESLGKPAEALPLFNKALQTIHKALGEEHPDTARSYNNVAGCLAGLGQRDEALRHLRHALLGIDVSRRNAASPSAGFERSLFAATQQPGRLVLACLLAGEDRAEEAWKHAEAHLARGLLDLLVVPRQRPRMPTGPSWHGSKPA
jgi:tetratricopeptide (TPR) repeat protein